MISRRNLLVVVICIMLCLSAFPMGAFAKAKEEAKKEKADTLYINGNIYTMQEKDFNVEALAIKGQKLLYVGTNEEAKKFADKKTKIVDLKGQTVIPGIIEAHLHYSGLGNNLLQLDVFWKPKEEILKAVKEAAEKAKPGEWITGRGWNQEVWKEDPNFPTKEDLDKVAPNNPVALRRTCGHATWVNSKALELAKITKDTPNPVGGEILKNSKGEVLGILTDTAAAPVSKAIPPNTDEKNIQGLKLAQEHLFSYGITSCMDAGTSVKMINHMKDLYKKGYLKIRVYEEVSSGEDAKKYYKIGPEIGLFDQRLTVRAIKFYTDGSLGARSAWMLEDYSDRKDHKGNGRYKNEDLYKEFKEAADNGFQSSVHAIGDAANRQSIDCYEKVIKALPDKDHRFRIEHFQIVDLKDIKRAADLKMIASMQFVHATSDKNMAEDRVGPERIKGAYAWRKVLDAGGIIANGSDAPVEKVNPYYGLYAGVSRAGTDDGLPKGGWYPAESLTRYEALRAFTLDAAYAQFEEDIKGSLEAGKLADFVVIDKDYMNCKVDEIKEIKALKTVLGGEVVYEAPKTETKN